MKEIEGDRRRWREMEDITFITKPLYDYYKHLVVLLQALCNAITSTV